MSESKHTPTPWLYEECMSDPDNEHSYSIFTKTDEQGNCKYVGDVHFNSAEDAEANAEFMKSAINSHNTLTAENKRLRELVEILANAVVSTIKPNDPIEAERDLRYMAQGVLEDLAEEAK